MTYFVEAHNATQSTVCVCVCVCEFCVSFCVCVMWVSGEAEKMSAREKQSE